MPRGYLKHHAGVIGRKKARGGASHRSNGKRREGGWSSRKEPRTTRDFAINPAVAVSPSQELKTQEEKKTPPPTHQEGECSICFEKRPLVCLSSTCRWHGAACEGCLHRYHVIDAQQSTNHPSKCFHPLCDHKISAAQLDHHGIFKSESQREAYHAMIVRAKIERSKKTKSALRTVLCPSCEMPRAIGRVDRDLVIKCRNCPVSYSVSSFYATLRALRALERSDWKDEIGGHECWKLCPFCGIMVSKGDGCDHVHCGNCNTHFEWSEATDLLTSRVPHGVVPENEIYMWW